ncbi:beta strand repeat-containing protein [Mesorhizobium sp. A556]
MVGRIRVLHMGSASALAIGAVIVLAPMEARACTATTTENAGVNIVCRDGDQTVQPFATSFGNGDGTQFYDGNGNDILTITGGSILATGQDTPVVNETYNLDPSTGVIEMGAGNNIVDISGGTIGSAATPIGIVLGVGANTFDMRGGALSGSVFGFPGGNSYAVSGGTIGGSIFAGGSNDTVTVSGNANIQGDAAIGPDSVGLEDGDDTFTMTGGTLGGAVSGGNGNDILTVSGGRVGTFLAGNDGDDQINVSGGAVGDDVVGGAGNDAVAVSGGEIAGGVEAERVTLTGGTIGGDISGIGPDTLIINDTLSPDPLSLRDGVVFSGTDANGALTDTDLAAGGTRSQNFNGFNTFSVGNSTLGFNSGTQDINQLFLTDNSTLFVNGNVNMPGTVTVTNSLIDMRDGAADDVLTLGGIVLDGGRIGVDIDQDTVTSDQLVANAFSATGVNTVIVNLLGTPQFAGPTDIPIIVATNGPVAGTFVVQGIPGTPGSLFTYEVVAGPDGGLFIRATPANFGIAAAPDSAINGATVENAIEAIYGINRYAIDADLLLSPGAGMVQLSPSFGVFASGQFAHTEHNGYHITDNVISGQGPSFDANDFSAAISLDFNAAKHFQMDTKYGLNIGVFAGYASSDVDLGGFGGFDMIGTGENKSGMFGAYALFRQGYNYGLVSASGFLGGTDVTNGVLNTTGSYDTQGYAVTGSVGHIFTLSDRARFDLRGGLLGVSFSGDPYTDSGGNQFGKSRVSFGAVKFEPGVYADYQLENGMVLSPYARGELQQRFGYRNTAEIGGRRINFDDADFSVALSGGFNLKMSSSATVNGEIRGKASSDSSTLGAKLGIKIAF